MKKLTFYLALVFASLICKAQTDPDADRKQYLFPHFIKGAVLFKTGATESASLNYNTADQSIIYEQDNQVMILTNLDKIDTIYLQNKKFVPGPDGLIYEVIMDHAPAIALYVSYTNKKRPAVAMTDQAGTEKKDQNETSNTLSSVYVSQPYKGNFIVDIQKSYWLIKSRQVYKATTEKQFEKVFPHQDDAIKKYIADNQTNFAIEDDLVKLTLFCNGNK